MTARLLYVAQNQWMDLDGYAVAHGINLLTLPIGRFCNFVWWWLTRDGDQQQVEKLKLQLWRPPPGYAEPITEGPWSAEAEMSAFSALKESLSK